MELVRGSAGFELMLRILKLFVQLSYASLEDVVFRRMMIGFDADQGQAYYEEIAALAAAETGWSPEIVAQQLGQLREYAASLRVG